MFVRRTRAGHWELRVTHRLLPKPFYATFDSEPEARDYGERMEALLARGIVLQELVAKEAVADPTLGVVLGAYLRTPLPPARAALLEVLRAELADVRLSAITYRWAEAWVAELKQRRLAPGTIRKRVSALSLALEHHRRRQESAWANPLRLLPRGYATYGPEDGEPRHDRHRDRRLLPGEEERIRAALAGERRPDRERPLDLPERAALELLFDLLVDTGLRLREAYTLTVPQVDLVTGTLNVKGSKARQGVLRPRQVPLKAHLRVRLAEWTQNRVGLLFPWWSGRPEDLDRTTSRLSRAFGRLFDYAGCPGLTEHDLRHEATCRWFELRRADGAWLFSEMEIAKLMGWSDTRMAVRYASLRGSDLAARLNEGLAG